MLGTAYRRPRFAPLCREMMKKWLILSAVILAGCATAKFRPPEPATHWARSDDWGEYNGVYLYSQTPDGRLWLTHYPEDGKGFPEEPVQRGFWSRTDHILNWFDMNHSNVVTYAMNKIGVFVEQEGHYYVPVTLKPITVKRRGVETKEDAQPGVRR